MSNANQTAISYCREASFKTPPIALSAAGVAGTNTIHALRFTKDGLLAEKETIISEEIRTNRMVAELIRVGLKNSGTIEAELSMKDYDDLIEAAFQADYGTVIAVTGSFAGDTFTAESGTPFAAIKNAKHVKIGSADQPGNNGIKSVISITDTVITVGAGQFTDNTVGDAITVSVTFVAAVDAVTVTVAGQVMTATTGTFSTAVQGARYLKIASAATAGNNGIKKVVSCTSTVLTLATGSLTGADTGDAITVTCNYVRTGSNYMTHLIQKEFADIAKYIAFTGMGVDTYDFKMEAKNKVMQTFGFFGCEGLSRTAKVNTLAAVAATTNGIINTSSMIGTLLKDGAAFGNPVMSASFQVKNNLRDRPVIASLFSQEHGVGFSEVTGELKVYFTSAEMLDAFLAHTAFGVEFPITDAAGNVMNIYLPSVQTATGSPDNSGINTDVFQTVQFRAVPHSTLGYQIQIDRLLAA